ncbi:hypothetical protein [Muricauda sp. MAR_2010_75]|uniref:hypothetical protein n=1 Tax=Allomuricauda sp. MAR_2010_75 TaxID=1250232 RepID=UPI00055A25A9|nr:hypothetical protein [Muricauda sp. MAR_2010_75]
MRNKRTILMAIGLVLGIVIVVVYKTLFPEPRNIATQRVDFTLSAKALVNEMSSEENAKKYGDKVVQTFGRIIAIDGSTITLGDGVVVNLMDSNPELEKGDSITVKGRCIGYDDLLGEVKLDQATIIQE